MNSSSDGLCQREIALRFAERGIDNPVGEAARIVEAAAAANARPLGELVEKRLSGIPLGQLPGTEMFLGVQMLVSTDMLAPRKETERLGQLAIQRLRADGVEQPTVIDMCCGAGNLACAIATHVREARIWASDITEACVDLARRNVERLGLGDRVQVMRGDLFSSCENQGLEGNVDLVVCNPPYISTGRLEGDRGSLLAYEAREAFDGGPYGLSIQQRVMRVMRSPMCAREEPWRSSLDWARNARLWPFSSGPGCRAGERGMSPSSPRTALLSRGWPWLAVLYAFTARYQLLLF